jgi:hypothetical protein
MTPSEELLVATLRESIPPRLRAGHGTGKIKRELLAQVERSLGRTHVEPALAALIPGRIELARRVLDEELAGLEEERN